MTLKILKRISAARAAETFRFLSLTLLALTLLSLTACKGRTMENMTPDGDTVEVTPDIIHDSTF